MDSRYGLPGKVLMMDFIQEGIFYSYKTKCVELPDYIDCSEGKIDVSDPYLIYRSAANRICYDDEVTFYKKQYTRQGELEMDQFLNGVAEREGSTIKLLHYLLSQDNVSSANVSEEMALMLIKSEIASGRAYLKLKDETEWMEDMSDFEKMRRVEYYLRSKDGGGNKIDDDVLIFRLADNLEKNNRDLWKLQICEMNVALRYLEPEAQIYYYDLFTGSRGKETEVWKKIRAHEFDINIKKCLDTLPKENLVTEELVERIRFQGFGIYRTDTIKSAIRFLCEEYIQTVVKGFVPYKICMGIQEWIEAPVFDVIGKDASGKIKIISFHVMRSDEFAIFMDYMVEVGEKIKVKAFIGNRMKRVRLK